MGKGVLVSTLSAVFFSSAVIFVRLAYQAGVLPGTAIFLRFTMAVILLGLALGLSRRWVKLPPRRLIALLLIGLLANTSMGVTWFSALSLSPVWVVSLVFAMAPLVISTASWFTRSERFEPALLPALGSVLLGGIVLFWRPLEGGAMAGVYLMLLNLLVNVFYVLVGKIYINPQPAVVAVFWILCGASLGTFLYATLSGQLDFTFQPIGWLWCLALAVLSTVLSINFLWWGIRLLGPARNSIIAAVEPVFSILLAMALLGERMNVSQILGGSFILAGVLLVRVQSARHVGRSLNANKPTGEMTHEYDPGTVSRPVD